MTRVVVLAVAVGVFAGCGGDDRVPVYPVSGRVTINGKAPPDGWVAALHLEPPPDTSGKYPHPLPRARVGPDGRFQFRTYGTADGAPAGTYKISFIDVTAMGKGAPDTAGEKSEKANKKSPQVYWPAAIEIRPEPNELPPFDLKY